MRPLIAQELVSLLPVLYCIVAFSSLDWLELLLSIEFTERAIFDLDDGGFEAVVRIIFAFAVGSRILVREIDDGTIRFIDGLPTTRSRLFVAKFIAAFLILLVLPGLEFARRWLAQSVTLTSLRRDDPLDPLLVWGLLSSVQILFGLSIALVMSFLRPFTWAAIGAYYWVHDRLEKSFSEFRYLEMESLNDVHYRGSELVIPVEAALAQIGFALLLLLVAHELFVRSGEDRVGPERLPAWLQRLRHTIGSIS